MESKKIDRRMLRSRKQMQKALQALIQEKEYNRISVADIAERAQVTRPTFYAHFKTKDDLLLSCFDHTFDRFFEALDNFLHSGDGVRAPNHTQRLVTKIFELWSEQPDMIRLLLQSGAEGLVLRRFQENTRIAFQMHMEQMDPNLPPALFDLIVHSLGSMNMSLLSYWLEHHTAFSPKTMGTIYESLLVPGLLSIVGDGELNHLFETSTQNLPEEP